MIKASETSVSSDEKNKNPSTPESRKRLKIKLGGAALSVIVAAGTALGIVNLSKDSHPASRKAATEHIKSRTSHKTNQSTAATLPETTTSTQPESPKVVANTTSTTRRSSNASGTASVTTANKIETAPTTSPEAQNTFGEFSYLPGWGKKSSEAQFQQEEAAHATLLGRPKGTTGDYYPICNVAAATFNNSPKFIKSAAHCALDNVSKTVKDPNNPNQVDDVAPDSSYEYIVAGSNGVWGNVDQILVNTSPNNDEAAISLKNTTPLYDNVTPIQISNNQAQLQPGEEVALFDSYRNSASDTGHFRQPKRNAGVYLGAIDIDNPGHYVNVIATTPDAVGVGSSGSTVIFASGNVSGSLYAFNNVQPGADTLYGQQFETKTRKEIKRLLATDGVKDFSNNFSLAEVSINTNSEYAAISAPLHSS